jgi:KDO2-lipid IV(A) lauroyltransferase
MKHLLYFLEYIVVAFLGVIIRLLPRGAVLFLGRRAGDCIFYCIPVRKKITVANIGRAFPEKSEKEIATIARDAYRNLAMNSFEHLCLQGLSKEKLQEIVEFKNEDILQNAFSRKKGVIFVGGHFGNWEYMGGAISSRGYPITYVVAGIANPYIDRMVNRHRMEMGITILPKGMSVRAMLKTLRKNEAMAMLMDQDAGRNGIFVDFFDRPCSTPKGPALFALKTGAAMVFLSSIRHPDGSLQVIFEEIELDYGEGVTEENINAIMQRCTAKLESYVREYPGHWLWMHRRWKTQPSMLGKN